ncbi:MAG: peptidoglycan-binding protein [Clostridia bacterium]|nr:peptidoglycan-binding protein [Clostridia bacterium]
MNGIDLSKWQAGIDLSRVPCDFVIIKATQGIKYISPEWEKQILQALSLDKCVGLYHYAGGGGVIKEANHYINVVKSYIGRAILVLDWEGKQNPNFKNHAYAQEWLQYVKDVTGITPFVYMSKSVCREYRWNPMYPLWVAQYANYIKTGYKQNPWTDDKGYGPWMAPAIFQYSSKGRLNGYNDDLDLDIAYITPEEWQAWAQGKEPATIDPAVKPTLKRGDRNEYVRAWQRLLNANGYQCGNADGIFGEKTEQAVIKWQQAHGMEAGYIGAQTWETI